MHTKSTAVADLAEGHLYATKVSNVMNNYNKNGMLKYWYSDKITYPLLLEIPFVMLF
jgi:hypothetical protein